MEEIWRDIEGYEGLYQVSNLGRVKSVERFVAYKDGRIYKYKSQIKKQLIDSTKQYWIVCLSDNRKNPRKKIFYVHILVAKAFLPNPNNYPLVMHIDQKNLRYDNECNNFVDNLKWGTPKQNASQDVVRKRMSLSAKKKIFTDKHKKNITKSLLGGARNQRPVICDGVIYSNIKKCAETYNIPPSTMRNWLRKNKIPNAFKDKGLRYIKQ